MPDSPDPKVHDFSSLKERQTDRKKTDSSSSSDELEISGVVFKLGESKEKDAQIYQLKKIIEKESGHG